MSAQISVFPARTSLNKSNSLTIPLPMPVDHYENFPVASLLIPKAQRPAVEAIYAFARSADDIADEGDADQPARLKALNQYLVELDRIEKHQKTDSPLFQRLSHTISTHQLPLEPFRDLISAFMQDVSVGRYQTFTELLDYCRRSANPVGRLMLHLFQRATPSNLARSDNICSALQLINFWQDIAIDWQKNRVYLPLEDMAKYRVTEQQIAEGRWNANFAALIDFEIDRTRQMMFAGGDLAKDLPGRFGWEIRLTVHGGLRILEKIRRQRGNVFAHRPTLKANDWALIALRTINY